MIPMRRRLSIRRSKLADRLAQSLSPCLLSTLAASLILSACTDEHPVAVSQIPKGDRVLAIQANMGGEGDYDTLFAEALAAGHEAQSYGWDWNELETAPGRFEPAVNYLAIANSYLTQKTMSLHLTLRPIHANRKTVPADISELPMDSPEVIERFKLLLDWVGTQVTTVELGSIVIDSEINSFMAGDDERWEEWVRFYAAVAGYARQKFPGTPITCETTFDAFSKRDVSKLRAMHQHSDIIGVSYYPLNGAPGKVQPPEDVHADFQTVVDSISTKPIIYYQIGYPSSQLIGSSDKQQARFITEVFRAWDTHSDRIHMLNFQWMHEAPPTAIDGYADYFNYDTVEFRAFLGSIGLQSWMGEPKPAWGRLSEEARSRGFGKFDAGESIESGH